VDIPQLIVVIAAILLIPLVPSYFLFKKIKTSANVDGTFQGLQIKLAGAFGGYFLLVLVCMTILIKFSKLGTPYDLWAIEGRIEFANGVNAVNVNNTRMFISPPSQEVRSDGTFRMGDVPLPKEVELSGQYPSINFILQGQDMKYLRVINLSEKPPTFDQDRGYNVKYSREKKTIEIENSFALNAIPNTPYSLASAQPVTATSVNTFDAIVKAIATGAGDGATTADAVDARDVVAPTPATATTHAPATENAPPDSGKP
jgi:hypothetical protein